MSKVKPSLRIRFTAAIRDIVQTVVFDFTEWRTHRSGNQANLARGNYVDGTPMSDVDLKLYGILDHVVIGGLTLLLTLVVLLIVLAVSGG